MRETLTVVVVCFEDRHRSIFLNHPTQPINVHPTQPDLRHRHNGPTPTHPLEITHEWTQRMPILHGLHSVDDNVDFFTAGRSAGVETHLIWLDEYDILMRENLRYRRFPSTTKGRLRRSERATELPMHRPSASISAVTCHCRLQLTCCRCDYTRDTAL